MDETIKRTTLENLSSETLAFIAEDPRCTTLHTQCWTWDGGEAVVFPKSIRDCQVVVRTKDGVRCIYSTQGLRGALGSL